TRSTSAGYSTKHTAPRLIHSFPTRRSSDLMASPTIQHTTSEGIAVTVFGELDARQREILTDEALEFLGYLHTKQNAKRKELLAARTDARAKVAAGEQLDFEKSTRTIREDD